MASAFGRCCNPFGEKPHFKTKSLRPPTADEILKLSYLKDTDRLCSTCRNLVDKLRVPENNQEKDEDKSFSMESLSQEADVILSLGSDISRSTRLPRINECLSILDISPIPAKKIKRNTDEWLSEKCDRIATHLKSSLGVDEMPSSSRKSACFDEMIEQLKRKYHETTDTNEKIQILTSLPVSWGVGKLVDAMDCTKHMAEKAKEAIKKHGVHSTLLRKSGCALSAELISLVKTFYEDDESSATMPGIKDFLSVRVENGKRVHKQKRLILCNLKELYEFFKQRHPSAKIGLSSFASLRPEYCVTAGNTSSTHSVCVCSTHQNMKLMIQGSNLPSLTRTMSDNFESWEDISKLITCDDPQPACYFGSCSDCPGVENLENIIQLTLARNDIDVVMYKKWITKPRTSLTTQTDSADRFAKNISDDAKILLKHEFIAKQQSAFLRKKKDQLPEGDIVIIVDFAENYSFVIQDAAPGFHWNNNQATIYPVVVYFKQNGALEHKSLVIISDCTRHDAVAVYQFSKMINEFLQNLGVPISKIFYFSDGAPQQFKNFKNFINVCHHARDFGVGAEWHFFATAHGKGPCDGVGGTIKRLAARASLQLPAQEQITTAAELYEWASSHLSSVSTVFCSEVDYERIKLFLATRFAGARPIKGTQATHCIIPIDEKTVKTKLYSLAEDSVIHKLYK